MHTNTHTGCSVVGDKNNFEKLGHTEGIASLHKVVNNVMYHQRPILIPCMNKY